MHGKTSIIFLIMVLCATFMFSGCSWAGRTAGKAQAKLERKADALEHGYKQGYGSEKSKTVPAPKSAEEPKKKENPAKDAAVQHI